MFKASSIALVLAASFIGAASAQAQQRGPQAGPMLPVFAWEVSGTAEQNGRFGYETLQFQERQTRDCIRDGCFLVHNPNRYWDVTEWEFQVRPPGSLEPPKWVPQLTGGRYLGPEGIALIATSGVDNVTMCDVPAVFTLVNRETKEESTFFTTVDLCNIPSGKPRILEMPLKPDSSRKGRVIIEDSDEDEPSSTLTASR